MKKKEQRPYGAGTHDRGDYNLEGKDKDKKSLSNRQERVYNLLRTGWHSAADISIALHYSDPRSYIRELREKGINVIDQWIEGEDTRYKRYHVKPQ